eukprot:4459114-Lingulodinium_polyedra.AAC.1
MANVVNIIRGLTPQGLQNGWTQLNRLRTGQRPSTEAWQTALRVARHGARHGLRPPSVAEKSRVTGTAAYLNML